MTDEQDMTAAKATALRRPFSPAQIGQISRQGTRRDGSKFTVYLDYVGHAATTDRLLQVDPAWTWEPCGVDDRGLPVIDADGGLWIRLTVCGVTRLGYGDAQGKEGPNAVKEAIGDAIRNAAMRFGVALDLWSKEDLSDDAHDGFDKGKVQRGPAPDDPWANASPEVINEWAEAMSGRISAESEDDTLRAMWVEVVNHTGASEELKQRLKDELTARARELGHHDAA